MQTDVVVRRIAAVILDGILLFVLSVVVTVMLEFIGLNTWDVESTDFSWSATTTFGGTLISGLLSLAYKAGMEGSRNGQTLGKQALGIRVVKEGSGSQISMNDALIRGLFWVMPFTLFALSSDYGLLGFIGIVWLIAGLISLITSPLRQRLGDRVANTVVVRDGFVPLPQPQFASATGMMASSASASSQDATNQPEEVWLTCDYCGSRFPRSRTHQGIWQGKSVALCPNCGAPIQNGETTS